MIMQRIFSFACMVLAGSSLLAQEVSWPPEIFKTPPGSRLAGCWEVPGLEAIFYEGLPVDGQPADVFAYVGIPQGPVPPGGWPAVVLVHGGGGTAFPKAVQFWNQKGFAAIAMDLEGHLPDWKPKDRGRRPSTPHPGPSRFPGAAFGDLNEPLESQWPYHAIAQIIKARRLLAARPEINPEKIGIVGWSWGGILTAIVMGADPGYAFGIIIYGAGFIPDSKGKLTARSQSPEFKEKLLKTWDPSVWVPKIQAPTFWINGTNDPHFPLDTWQRTVDVCGGGPRQLIIPDMAHGHHIAWTLEEMIPFATAIVQGRALPASHEVPGGPTREKNTNKE